MKEIVRGGEAIGVPLIPVIGLSTDTKTQNVAFGLAKNEGRGLCLRLFRPDLIDSAVLAQKIKAVTTASALPEKDIDLLIDLKNTDEECLKLTDLCGRIPSLLKWRTFTVASGAFPPDLTDLSVDLHFKDRADWNAW